MPRHGRVPERTRKHRKRRGKNRESWMARRDNNTEKRSK